MEWNIGDRGKPAASVRPRRQVRESWFRIIIRLDGSWSLFESCGRGLHYVGEVG